MCYSDKTQTFSPAKHTLGCSPNLPQKHIINVCGDVNSNVINKRFLLQQVAPFFLERQLVTLLMDHLTVRDHVLSHIDLSNMSTLLSM